MLLAPHFLWLLALVPVVWVLPRRASDLRHVTIRSVVLIALAVGLARPVLWVDDASEVHVLVWDRSPSVEASEDRAAGESIDRLLANLPDDADVILIEVGGAGRSPVELNEATRIARRARFPGRSDLAAALAEASRSIPARRPAAVTVWTDGLAVSRDWARGTSALTAREIPVHTVRLATPPGNVVPISLTARQELRVGQTAEIEVEVITRGPVASGTAVEVTLSELSEGVPRVLATAENVLVDARGTVLLTFEPESAGFLVLEASVRVTSGVDTRPDDNTMRRTFAVQEPLRVLYIGERVRGGAEQLGGLVGRGFRIVDSASLSDQPVPPSAYDLIMVDDRSASTLPEPLQEEFVRAVRDQGVGLVMSGGGASFGPGGYHDTPLAIALPVEFVQKEEKRDPSTTLVVIVDTSGSMAGNRVQLAKETARLAIRRLLPHDKVGIVEFYGAKRWAAPIQPASNAIDLQRALNRLDAGGGTVILPAIEESFYALQNVQTRYKHVLVLTDGGVETGPFESLLRRMSDKGMTVSTVLVGPETHSEFLVNLANWGKGRFYNVPNRFNLPEILLKQPNTSRIPAYRPGVHPVRGRGGPGWWGSVDRSQLPPLAGYVETRQRPGSEVLIETTNGAHPILATWQYGLGRVFAFTTEPTGPGTAPWREWDGYGSLLARVLTRAAADSRAGFDFSIERRDHRVVVRADRRVHDELTPEADLLDDHGNVVRSLSFRERADGVFTAEWRHDPNSETRVLGRSSGSSRSITRLVSSAHDDLASETRVDPRGALDLDRLATATGGRSFDTVPAGAWVPTASGTSGARTLRDLWPWCFALALLGYLVDLAYRRRPGAA